MKIYSNGSFGRGTTIITPGADVPKAERPTAWVNEQTGECLSFTVKFKGGVADVDDQIGKYMIARKLAFRSPLILPETA